MQDEYAFLWFDVRLTTFTHDSAAEIILTAMPLVLSHGKFLLTSVGTLYTREAANTSHALMRGDGRPTVCTASDENQWPGKKGQWSNVCTHSRMKESSTVHAKLASI